jgi:hypothetical protein
MVQAHRYAHGVDGRPDLIDARLNHEHGAVLAPSKNANNWLKLVAAVPVLALFGFLAGTGNSDAISALIFVALGIGAYFIPTMIAASRKHHNIGAVAVINFFLGWTFIGWIVALAMAASAVRSPDRL